MVTTCGYVCANRHSEVKVIAVTLFFGGSGQIIKINAQQRSYLIGPGVFIPCGELQDSDDLVDFSAHLFKGKPSVPLCLLDAGTSAALRCDKNLYSCEQNMSIDCRLY